MRSFAALLAALTLSTAALAGQADGTVTKVDPEKETVTLDDGNTYKVPGEFDVATLKEGMQIIIAYDQVNGQNQITDMQLPDEQ